ncbi:acyl-CoA dehydrogenase [Shewanella corallii]|uniref:Acyl-coenzyme A dehydrogenase n=1 Tax=Shewanella corallii TaxID=560080 RepID=A0ABT0N6N9_9GAMM|nr:acyl-CoA dehydrogenase [Shewanella corallii]MCL2914093.1 acyl-CoA dehydrogenase [Shewanella corallii]
MISFLLLLTALIVVLFGVTSVRRQVISRPAFAFFKRVLPPLSDTERQAMEAGDIWWEGELFGGKPDWDRLHGFGKSELTPQEQEFIKVQVSHALSLIDDYDIVHNRRDLPPELWEYFRKEGFFSLIIPKQYGGHEFSAYANSTIVSMLASRSISAAVTVMVPNSLGPGELLSHYGTREQKEQWLPALAKGDEIPCFALTGPEAGSDAGAIPDTGVVCLGEFAGEEVTGIRLNWDKRYITLAPVATVLGLAFKLKDPDGLLGDKQDIGITCALIPVSHPGVETGIRHDPLGLAFMNGTTRGKDVFIPLDWIIGGAQYAGHGWRMLVECLSAGRGISLPALATASGHMATKTTTAYSAVRQQFGMPIGAFEGVQEALARIIGNTYQLEAARRLTTTGLDLKVKPSVVTAIAKYHMTEMGRSVMNDAMDIQAGKGIQLGPKNYLGHHYMANPLSITVEGANILTRSLMIFGQGATRCHPFVLKEMAAASMDDEEEGLDQFDELLISHIIYAYKNGFRAFGHALTGSRLATTPVSGETRTYYQHMERISSGLAIATDFAMLVMGGELKRREMMSARLGDVLSQLYLASATLKLFEDNGRQYEDLPVVHYVMQTRLQQAAAALKDVVRNFPNPVLKFKLGLILFPLGNHFNGPSDETVRLAVEGMLKPGPGRSRLTFLCPDLEGDTSGIAEVETAFMAMHCTQSLRARVDKAIRKGKVQLKSGDNRFDAAYEAGIITAEESDKLKQADEARKAAIAVDEFDKL